MRGLATACTTTLRCLFSLSKKRNKTNPFNICSWLKNLYFLSKNSPSKSVFSPKKGSKRNPVEVGSYLGNLFAVLPLVRYYWEASFCHRQFRGFRASLVFTKPFPQAPPKQSHNSVSLFLTSVSSLSLRCHTTTRLPNFPETLEKLISGRSQGLGSTVGGARAAPLFRTHRTDTGFLAGEKTGSCDRHASSSSLSTKAKLHVGLDFCQLKWFLGFEIRFVDFQNKLLIVNSMYINISIALMIVCEV